LVGRLDGVATLTKAQSPGFVTELEKR
jgi:hypothetical protein